jgi:nucleotide-binding universal stress UspA family protein
VLAAHPGIEVHMTVVEESPSLALVRASQGAALLAVGSRGHGEFVGMLLGSVGQHCATNAHCPVLVLRDDQEAAASDHTATTKEAIVSNR